MNDKDREAFERVARSIANAAAVDKCWLRDCGDIDATHTYQNPDTERAWMLFQRAVQQAALQSPEVKALVEAAQVMSDMLAALEPLLPTPKLVQSSVWARQNYRQALAAVEQQIMEQEVLEKLTYEALEHLAESRLEEIKKLEGLLKEWQSSFHVRSKHVLAVESGLTDEQYSRLKNEMNEMFGHGNVILLEGGVKYLGMTHHPLPQE